MSVWTAPITWTNAAVTAAQMNAEIRDHASFLKGFGDLITASTTADTGTSTYLSIARTSTGQTVIEGRITGDAQPRVRALSSGVVEFGDGTSAPDLQLTRVVSSSAGLTLNGYLQSARATGLAAFNARVTGDANDRFHALTNGPVEWGDGTSAIDTRIARAAANVLELASSPATKLRGTAASSTSVQFETLVSADAAARWQVDAAGKMTWGDGTAQDNTIERIAANQFLSNSFIRVERATTGLGGLAARTSGDTVDRWLATSSGALFWSDGSAAVDLVVTRASANLLELASGDSINLASGTYRVAGTAVVGARQTGWTAATNTKLRTTFDTTTVTLPNLAARVGALLDDLISHGLIGS